MKRGPRITHRWPQVLPGGRAVLFTASLIGNDYTDAHLAVHSLETGNTKIVHRGGFYARYLESVRVGARHHVPTHVRGSGERISSVDPGRPTDRVQLGSRLRLRRVGSLLDSSRWYRRVPMLLGGKGAPRFAELMRPFGMKLEVLGEDVGLASAIKMFRSVMIKGLEALILECRQGARQFDAEERGFRSPASRFPGSIGMSSLTIFRSAPESTGSAAGVKMEEAAKTLKGLGVEPIMAEAAAKRLLAGDT